tara:strand:- start:16645 stop:18336 length:1692 start_codon:yes stop_codon:yes gene_type:complete
MSSNNRITINEFEGINDLFTDEFIAFLVSLHDEFTDRIHQLRQKRREVLTKALNQGVLPDFLPPSEATTTNWVVPDVPEDLKRPGIEITGPASVTNMFINALNPGPDGTRAEGDLDDDEDAGGHRFIDTLTSARNRLAAVERTLEYTNPITSKHYSIQDGEIPFFMHRERGLHLDEEEVSIDGIPIPAAILGTALTLFYAGRAQIGRGQGVYFYLPKMEAAEEAALWRDFFDFSSQYLNLPKSAVIRAIPLVESLPLAYQMEETLFSLGPYAAGLNAARWDFKASIFEFIMSDSKSVWPDRFGVDVKTTEFLSNIFRRLVAVCLKHGAVPIGGMATALPSRDTEVNTNATTTITADKEWEAKQGFLRAWVAHIFHMKTAAEPFKQLRNSGWEPTDYMKNPENYPVELQVPDGPITTAGTRRNARMVIEYLEGWLDGRGAKGIDSQAGQPGIHGPLMEDLATGRMSVAQIAQRIIHGAKDSDTGEATDFILVKTLLQEELDNILLLIKKDLSEGNEFDSIEDRYRKAYKIAMRWIKNYTEFNFRSLGSYSHTELEEIASLKDAL